MAGPPELTQLAAGELPQQDPQRGRAYTPANSRFIPPARIRSRSPMRSAPASSPPITEVSFVVGFAAPELTAHCEDHVLVQQVRQAGLFGQFHDRDQPGAGHQIHVIEHGGAAVPPMRQFHRKCPSDPR